jgi:hypothetical protein
MEEIKENKKTYFIKAGTAIIGKIKDTFYEEIKSYYYKREREIYFIREQVAAIINKKEKIYYERVE